MFWFTQFVAKYTRKRLPATPGKKPRGVETGDGRINQRQKVVRAFRRNESVIDAFSRQQPGCLQGPAYTPTRMPFLLMPLTTVLGNFFVIVLSGLGGWLALRKPGQCGPDRQPYQLRGRTLPTRCAQLATCITPSRPPWPEPKRVFEIIDTPLRWDDGPDAGSRWNQVHG